MYIFEALKYLMYQESTRELIYTARSLEKRRDIRGIVLQPAYEYSKRSHVYSMFWSEHLENNVFNLRFPTNNGLKKSRRLFSRIKPGIYMDSDGTLLRVNKPEDRKQGIYYARQQKI